MVIGTKSPHHGRRGLFSFSLWAMFLAVVSIVWATLAAWWSS